MIPRQLGHSVMTQGIGLILLGVGAIEHSIKDIVGADMNESGPSLRTEPGDSPRGLRINPGSQLPIPLAAIDVRGSCTVHNNIPRSKIIGCQSRLGFLGIGKIDLGTGQGNNLRLR